MSLTQDEIENQKKRLAFERAAGKLGILSVFFCWAPNVSVPEGVYTDRQACLPFNNRSGRGDLTINDKGIRETLYFSGSPFECFVPWSAIHWIADKAAGACYYESPELVALKANAEPGTGAAPGKRLSPPPLRIPKALKRRPNSGILGVIDGGGETTPPVFNYPNHLKVVRTPEGSGK